MKHLSKIFILLFWSTMMIIGLACSQKSEPSDIEMIQLPIQGNPLIHIRILLGVGSGHDPAGQEGITALTLNLLQQGGTETMSYKEIQKRFYPMAAYVGLQVDKEMSVFSGTIHRDNLAKYIGLFKEMLLKPGFREDDFTRIKTDQINYLEKTLVSNRDEQFGKEILNLMMYQNHPYGTAEEGTVKSLEKITLDDVKAHYEKIFLKGNVIIGLAGGYSQEFASQLKKDFSILPDGTIPRLQLPAQKMPNGLEFVIAEKKTPATAISMGFPIPISRADKDFIALWVAGSHFGEHRQHLSHLFQKIREERGQNYGDYAYIEHFIQGRRKYPATNYCRQQQYFSIWIRPLINSNRHFVIRQAVMELKKLVEEGISEERFQLTQKYLLNYTKLYTQTLGERLGWKMDSKYYGFEDFLTQAREKLAKVTREEVNQAIKKYLNFENIYIAIITQNAAQLKADLVANTPSPIKYANPNMPKHILEEDKIYQAFLLKIKAENVHIAPAGNFFRTAGLPEDTQKE